MHFLRGGGGIGGAHWDSYEYELSESIWHGITENEGLPGMISYTKLQCLSLDMKEEQWHEPGPRFNVHFPIWDGKLYKINGGLIMKVRLTSNDLRNHSTWRFPFSLLQNFSRVLISDPDVLWYQDEQLFLVGSFSLDKLCLVKCWRRHLSGVRRLA